MRPTKSWMLLVIAAVFWMSFSNELGKGDTYAAIKTVDLKATKQTKALFANLKKNAPKHTMFGHQDDLAYGVMWRDWNRKKSDVKDVCGSYPAVFGWDIGKLGQEDHNLDQVKFQHMRKWMKEVFKMGGVNTVSWHVDNFVTGSNSWDVGEMVVAAILPGGEKHDMYKESLDVLAKFFKSLEKGFLFKKQIPVIFRPFHEHTGSWFWWGQPHCTPEEYKQLWQFTVTYLRDKKEVRNLLYCYSTDIFKNKAHYLECYPGDDYVDILGVDDYHDVGKEGKAEDLTKRLRMLVEIAEEKGKVAALTETGLEAIPDETWWTEKLLKHIMADPVASRIAWVLVWRNANQEHDRPNHHYAPYPGHSSAANFMEFCKDPSILMEDKLPDLYSL